MTVLCIDPGSKMGFSVWSHKGSLLDFGTLKAPPGGEEMILQRLSGQLRNVDGLIRDHEPSVLVIEDTAKGRHQGWQAKFWLIYTCLYAQMEMILRGGQVVTVAPRRLKSKVLGNGNATKQDMVDYVNKTHKLQLPLSRNDEADAIGLGEYYFNHHKKG